MTIICSIDHNWGLGKNGNLLERIPEDLKNFRKVTENNVIIMGKTTFQSLPNGPLKNRTNMILTRDVNFQIGSFYENTIVCNSIEDVLLKTKELDKEKFIIGGGQIYEQFLPYCDKAYITKIFNTYDADTFMVNLDDDKNWYIDEHGERKHFKDDIYYQFLTYVRIK